MVIEPCAAAQPGSSPTISALVCTRGRGATVTAAVRTILLNSKCPIEVLVIDQSSDTSTEEALRVFEGDARFRYVRSETVGLGSAQNLGLRMLTSDIVAITDDDCSVPEGWAETIVAAFSEHPDVAVVFCDVRSGPHDRGLGFVPTAEHEHAKVIRTLTEKRKLRCMGAGMAVRRAEILDIGGFDDELGPGARFPSAGDRDIAVRALLNNHAVLHTVDTFVVHHGFRTWLEGRALAGRDWQGVGAAYSKPLRAGHWRFLAVVGSELWAEILRPIGGDVVRLRKPRGVFRLTSFARGFYRGWGTPMDRATLTFGDR